MTEENRKMTKEEIINLLEKRFKRNHNIMELEKKCHNYKHSLFYASICREIARILAEINETTAEREMERLYKKFNLYKGE